MPLRVFDGIPIDVPVPQPGLTLEDVFESTTIEALPIARNDQESGAWCYAACAEMVITFCNDQVPLPSPTQCNIVSFVKAGSGGDPDFCCNTTGNVCTETGCEVQDISRIFDFFQIEYEKPANGPQPFAGFGPVGLATLTAEFEARRPVEVIVDWDDDGSHAVLVTGVADDMVFVIDPLEDGPYGGWQTVDSLQAGFGLGNWARTWLGLRRIQ